MGVAAAGETPNLTGQYVGETHRVLGCTQTTHQGISTRRAQFACEQSREVNESLLRAEQLVLFPLRPLPYIQCHSAVM